MTKQIVIVLAMIATIAVGLAACGKSDGTAPSGTSVTIKGNVQ